VSAHSKKISWVSFLVLDKDLHKTTQIELLKKLAERGHITSLFAIHSNKKYKADTNSVHINSIPLRYVSGVTTLIYSILLFLYLPIYALRSKPDYVIVEPRDPTFLCAMSLVPIPKAVRPKIVLDIRSVPIGGGFIEALLFKNAMGLAKKFFDGITIITPMMRQEICGKFNINPATMGVWTSGVSTTTFNPKKFDQNALRKSMSLENKFVVLYHGSLGASYFFGQARGVASSIRSLKILKQQYPDLVLFLLGDSQSFTWIKKLSQEYGVEDRVILHKSVDHKDVPKFIALCDAALVPLPGFAIWRNQCALKLLEYLSMEKVVIATDIPANSYVLGKYKCGVYIKSANPEDIAEGIAYVHDNKEKLKEWGTSGRTIIDEKFSWDKVAENLESYLLKL
jgi:glycosyltransferase involved in cell wall biosynthesis